MDTSIGDKLLSPPPYHQAIAYAKVQPPRRLRRIFSFRLALALLLAVQLSWLYLWDSRSDHPRDALTALETKSFEAGLASCITHTKLLSRVEPNDRKGNPRWNSASGQNNTIVLRNATLFDGNDFLDSSVDIVFSKGLITSVTPSGSSGTEGAREFHLDGAYVTPGLVDMHSHHLVEGWPLLSATDDSNEMHFGPITPFVNAIDSMKAYDRKYHQSRAAERHPSSWRSIQEAPL